MKKVPGDLSSEKIRSFWEMNPLSARIIPFKPGTKEYFTHYDELRERNESVEFSFRLHEYSTFKGKMVLDVGCGNGYVLSKYAQSGAIVNGIDITRAGIELSKRRFELLGLQGCFYEASAEKIPFPDETFDCVCSMGVLHHVHNTELAVKEIYRVLKPGGKLIVMFYHRNSALYRIKFPLLKLVTKKTLQECVNEVDGVGNPKGDVYSKRELGRLLNDFSEIKMFVGLLQGKMFLPKVGKFIPDILVQPFANLWGWFLYAKGCKPIK